MKFLVFALMFFLAVFQKANASSTDLSHSFGLGLIIASPNYGLGFKPSDETVDTELDYQANLKSLYGYQVSAFGFSLSYLTDQPTDTISEEAFGKTTYDEVRIGFYFGNRDQWYWNGYYTRYKGLYVENSVEVDNSLSSTDAKIQNPDIQVFTTGGGFLYIFDPVSYSAAAAFTQSAQQKTSGGSWLARFVGDHILVFDENKIIPEQVSSQYGVDKDLVEARFLSLSLQGGYGQTWVWNNFFFTAQLMFGPGAVVRSYKSADTETVHDQSSTSRLSFWVALGYNAEHFYLAYSSTQDSTSFRTASIRVSSTLMWSQVSVGFRF